MMVFGFINYVVGIPYISDWDVYVSKIVLSFNKHDYEYIAKKDEGIDILWENKQLY